MKQTHEPMRSKISRGGQISVPARVRNRWRAEAVEIEDHGDHLVVRPEDEDPIARVRGILKGKLTQTSYEIKQEERELDTEIEDRKFGRR